MSDNLKKRVEQFQCLRLPGQNPMSMHMGTSYLVNDLWNECEKLQTENRRLGGLIKDVALGLQDGHTIDAESLIEIIKFAEEAGNV